MVGDLRGLHSHIGKCHADSSQLWGCHLFYPLPLVRLDSQFSKETDVSVVTKRGDKESISDVRLY